MNPELIVVNGPLAGKRCALESDILVGRAPNAQIVLSDPEVGWRHCQIRRQGDRFVLTDLRTATGTYVNGMRSAERWLEDRDQIGIAKTVLMFRSGQGTAEEAPAPVETKPVLLAACSLVFMFRALAGSASEGQTSLLREQILRVIGDLVPMEEGVVVLGANEAELARQVPAKFVPAVAAVCEHGAIEDRQAGVVGVPLYIQGLLSGAIIVRISPEASFRADNHLDILTAIASLASIGFEANQEVETLKAEKALLEEQIAVNTGIVGESPAIRKLLGSLERVAPHDTRVLITGESGTGKELIARALHQKSPRRDRPFIAVNCAAFSETLFESELFGHEKGAFTGAVSLKQGRFEIAQGGTIFLDEIGELPLSLQPKLLRVLEERVFERVGGTQPHPLDVRVISATNRDLSTDLREGKFRRDLYHRLNAVMLESPPLRDRRDDIPLLARYFLRRSAERCKRHVSGITPEAEDALKQYEWPGNVRELENVIERAVVMGEGISEWVLLEDLPESLLESAPIESGAKYHNDVSQAKREAILNAYVQGHGDYKQAAHLLGLHPNYLLRLVRNLGLREEINRTLSKAAGR